MARNRLTCRLPDPLRLCKLAIADVQCSAGLGNSTTVISFSINLNFCWTSMFTPSWDATIEKVEVERVDSKEFINIQTTDVRHRILKICAAAIKNGTERSIVKSTL